MFRNLYDLDSFALDYAVNHPVNSLRGDTTINEAPLQGNPSGADIIPLYHTADGIGYGVTVATLAALIGTGTTVITPQTSFGGLVFQYGNYVFQQLPSAGAAANSTALINMYSAMSGNALSGGEAWIPQATYPLNFQSNGFLVPFQSITRALGGGGTGAGGGPGAQAHFVFSGDGLGFSCTGPHTSGGAYFESIAFQVQSATLASTLCIGGNFWNTRARYCTFQDWPAAFNAGGVPSGPGSQAGLSSGLDQCTITYKNGPSGSLSSISPKNGCLVPPVPLNDASLLCPVMVTLSAPQVFAIGPGEYFQAKRSSGGPTNVVGVGIGGTGGGPVEHAVVRDLHLSDFTWAISYCFQQSLSNGSGNAGSKGSIIESVEAQSWASSVFMMNPGANGSIWGDKYIGCVLEKSGGSTDASAIVYIDATTNGAAYTSVQDIEFTDCSVFSISTQSLSGCHGYNIFSGDNIRIIGGSVANMGTSGANIKLSGTSVGHVTVVGTRLGATLPNASQQLFSGYALLVSALPSQPCLISSCPMDGSFGVQPVQVTATISSPNLFITNCQGYNDQNVVLISGGASAPTSSTSASVTAITGPGGSSASTGYFGPQVVFGQNTGSNTTITINGHATVCPANGWFSFFLNSPYDTLQFSQATTTFFWIGK